MITILTAILVLGVVWGGFAFLLVKAWNSEKGKNNG